MSLFQLNSKIELITEDDKKTSGLILDIEHDKIYVSIPSDDKEFKILRVGDHLNGLVYNKKKVISFDAVISARVKGDIPTYELSSISNFVNIQRRQDVRVHSSIDLLFTGNKYLLKANDEREDAKVVLNQISKYVSNGIVSDLSAGGLRFSCDENFNIGHDLLLVFNVIGDTIITKGKIVYKELNSAPNKTIYIYGIEFNNIDESKREKIINHIFVLMRKKRLK